MRSRPRSAEHEASPKTRLRTMHRIRSSLGAVIAGIAVTALATVGGGIAARLAEPVGTVLIVGDLNLEQRAWVSAAVEPFSRRGLFRLDATALREVLTAIGWTRSVRVRRLWPDRLEVTVEAEVPMAQWGSDRLLNSQGRVIAGVVEVPGSLDVDGSPHAPELPRLVGPEGSAVLVMERYSLAREMAAPLGLRVTQLTLDRSVGWSMVFDNGIELILGRDDSIARMKRFQKLYQQRLSIDAHRVLRADARYANGVSVMHRVDPSVERIARLTPVAIRTHGG